MPNEPCAYHVLNTSCRNHPTYRRLTEPTLYRATGTYFDGYNLVQAAVVEPFPGRAAPRYLAGLAQLMRREQVRAVVIEPQLSTNGGAGSARETGARVGLLDPYGTGVPGR